MRNLCFPAAGTGTARGFGIPARQDLFVSPVLGAQVGVVVGVEVGVVARVDHFPAQDILAVTVGEKEVLVPFVKAIVPEVNVEAGTVTVTPPNGLFEEIEE